jgi:hypothetical protein
MTQRCKCEHWQDCPTCAPQRFDADGKRKPPEPTPLQACRAELESMREVLALHEVGVVPDGAIGPRTLAALNGCDPELFALKYALAKVSRYAEICNRDRTQSKFLLGWINRTLKELT